MQHTISQTYPRGYDAPGNTSVSIIFDTRKSCLYPFIVLIVENGMERKNHRLLLDDATQDRDAQLKRLSDKIGA